MSEVSFPRRLGSRNESSINDEPYLPLGNKLYQVIERVAKKNPITSVLTLTNNYIVNIIQIVKNELTPLTVKYISNNEVFINESFVDTDVIDITYTFNKIAAVTTNFNDDDIITTQNSATNSDAYARNLNYDEQQLNYSKRSLIGKKSGQTSTSLFDHQQMTEYNQRVNTRISEEEVRDYKESHYNLVASPFTTAEKFVIPT
jgi:hypothetical protein